MGAVVTAHATIRGTGRQELRLLQVWTNTFYQDWGLE